MIVPISKKTYFTTTEASELLGLDRRTVSQYCKRGILDAVKVGRDWLLPKSEVDRYKKERHRPGNPKFSKSA